MERVTECQWDRTLSDGKGDVMIFGNGIFGTLVRTFTVYLERVTEWYLAVGYAGTNIYHILGSSGWLSPGTYS